MALAVPDPLVGGPGAQSHRGRDPRGGASERAVDVQIARLRRKIEADPRNPRYLQTVWGEGYTLLPD